MSAAMLEVERLRVWYGAAQILFEPSFHVGRGEVVALMGRNGAGKSTTLKAVMALIPQRSGMVRFLSEDISRLKPFEIARRGLGFVPEDRRIFSDLTVLENLDVGRQPLRHHPDGRPAPSWTPEKLFMVFPNLRDMPDRRGAHMSGHHHHRAQERRIVGALIRAEHPFRRARLRPRLCFGERAATMARPHGRPR